MGDKTNSMDSRLRGNDCGEAVLTVRRAGITSKSVKMTQGVRGVTVTEVPFAIVFPL